MELDEFELSSPRNMASDIDLNEQQVDVVELTNVSQLPPADGGWAAWSYLVGAFFIEALCWGLQYSYGVFQSYLMTHPPFQGNKLVPLVGTVLSGSTYILAPINIYLTNRFPNYRKTAAYAGFVLCVSATIVAAFTRQIWQLIIAEGLYGIGSGLIYIPSLSYLNEWFVRRRGLAYGIMFGGNGIAGLTLPLFFQWVLNKYGLRVAFLTWASSFAIFVFPLVRYTIKGRLPISQVSEARRLDLTFLKNPFFLTVAFSNLIQGFGYFLPTIYIPTIASDLNIDPTKSSIPLSMLNLSSVFGKIAFGYVSDKRGALKPLFMSSSIAGLSVLLLLGLSKGFATLLLFGILYGLSAGAYSVMWSKFPMEVDADNPHSHLLMFGVFAFERGIGNIVAGPISTVLNGHLRDLGSYGLGKYKGMVLFSGLSLFVSAFIVLGNVGRPFISNLAHLRR